jgi:SMC interacting uncharacterized protein involved in chromosome segregation
MTQSTDTEIKQLIEKLDEKFDKLSEDIIQLKSKINEIDSEVKAWGNWLRTASGAIIFVVSISFLGAFIGLLLPIAFTLWRNI